MARPSHLPEYVHPPVNEVTLGVQFATPQGYSQLHSGGVWNLFRKEYPNFEEHEPLAQSFEVFGSGPISMPSIEWIQGPRHDRFWFISNSPDELLQFQNDRLHFNWRTVAGGQAYPRFEHMVEKFFTALKKLDKHFMNEFAHGVSVVQAEVSYINHFPFVIDGKSKKISDWVNFIRTDTFPPEDVNLRMRYPLQRDGSYYGRVNLDLATAMKPTSEKIAVLTTTVKGTPQSDSFEHIGNFFLEGRALIVKTFDSVTTEWAHSYWNRSE